jgi:hypothetical protein
VEVFSDEEEDMEGYNARGYNSDDASLDIEVCETIETGFTILVPKQQRE